MSQVHPLTMRFRISFLSVVKSDSIVQIHYSAVGGHLTCSTILNTLKSEKTNIMSIRCPFTQIQQQGRDQMRPARCLRQRQQLRSLPGSEGVGWTLRVMVFQFCSPGTSLASPWSWPYWAISICDMLALSHSIDIGFCRTICR